jgi:hypothetical protein
VNADTVLPLLLVAQGVIGGLDTMLNHELVEKLPSRPDACREIGLHWVREAIYGGLFCGLAWFAWHGVLALVIAGLLVGEAIITLSDEYVENKTRVLPQNERVLHVFLTINYGVIAALLLPLCYQWFQQPAGLIARDFGWLSWALTALGVASFAWAVRDLIAWRRLRAMAIRNA